MGNAVINPTLSGRQWGDGALAGERAHVIEAISYAEDRIDCRCGAAVTGIADGTAWSAHGGKVMAMERVERAVTPESGENRENTDDSLEAMEALVALAARCTCTPDSDIKDCPNYTGDDDEELVEEGMELS